MQRLFALMLLLTAFVVATPVVFAQNLLQQNTARFQITPTSPKPGEDVLITIEGVGSFLGDSKIIWSLNGKVVRSGIGETSYSFTAGPLGSKSVVDVSIVSGTNGTITKSFTISPSQVELLWEADTSSPSWYKGKSLYTAGSRLVVYAIPQVVLGGKAVPASSLSYQWSQNDTPLPQKSGLGKNRIAVLGSQLLPGEKISVRVSYGGSEVGAGSITIPAAKPAVLVYVKDPLRGLLTDSALGGTVSLASNEFTAQAEAFGFSTDNITDGSVQYAWKLNGKEVTGPQTSEGILTLRQSGSGGGSAALQVSLQNTDSSRFVQAANTSLRILFGRSTNSSASSFFGI